MEQGKENAAIRRTVFHKELLEEVFINQSRHLLETVPDFQETMQLTQERQL